MQRTKVSRVWIDVGDGAPRRSRVAGLGRMESGYSRQTDVYSKTDQPNVYLWMGWPIVFCFVLLMMRTMMMVVMMMVIFIIIIMYSTYQGGRYMWTRSTEMRAETGNAGA